MQADREQHELDKTVAFLQTVGCATVRSRQDIWPETYEEPADRERAEQIVRRTGGEADHLRIAVCAGARFTLKDWGADGR